MKAKASMSIKELAERLSVSTDTSHSIKSGRDGLPLRSEGPTRDGGTGEREAVSTQQHGQRAGRR